MSLGSLDAAGRAAAVAIGSAIETWDVDRIVSTLATLELDPRMSFALLVLGAAMEFDDFDAFVRFIPTDRDLCRTYVAFLELLDVAAAHKDPRFFHALLPCVPPVRALECTRMHGRHGSPTKLARTEFILAVLRALAADTSRAAIELRKDAPHKAFAISAAHLDSLFIVACRENNVEVVRELLSFKSFDTTHTLRAMLRDSLRCRAPDQLVRLLLMHVRDPIVAFGGGSNRQKLYHVLDDYRREAHMAWVASKRAPLTCAGAGAAIGDTTDGAAGTDAVSRPHLRAGAGTDELRHLTPQGLRARHSLIRRLETDKVPEVGQRWDWSYFELAEKEGYVHRAARHAIQARTEEAAHAAVAAELGPTRVLPQDIPHYKR